MLRRALLVTGALLVFAADSARIRADIFGTGDNQFTIDFVTIGNPGNPADTTGVPNPAGSVSYLYRIGKYEISRAMVEMASATGALGLTLDPMDFVTGGPRPDMPATGVSWNEAARFVNWLNTSRGFPPAYKFSTQPGDAGYDANQNIQLWQAGDAGFNPANQYRNARARYVLPTVDEWYKAAYYDPQANGGAGVYWDYATGADSIPMPVHDGIIASTAVWSQPYVQGPAEITQAGGMSAYGVMAQAGNVYEWEETEQDLVNDDAIATRGLRGCYWGDTNPFLVSSLGRTPGIRVVVDPSSELSSVGFRVAAIPEPSTRLMASLGIAVFLQLRRSRRRTAVRCMVKLHVATLIGCFALATSGRADIYRWDTGEVIPGTEGITPGPGVNLASRQLEYADLRADLTGAIFNSSDLKFADFDGSRLTYAQLRNADLTGANLSNVSAYPGEVSEIGLDLSNSNLSEADLRNAFIPQTSFRGANLSGALVAGTYLASATRFGFTASQLYSTSSYRLKKLDGIGLGHNELTGWDFSGQDLSNARFTFSRLADAKFSDAIIAGAEFDYTTLVGFSQDQFQSTVSFQTGRLRGINLQQNNLAGWDFRGKDLSGTDFSGSDISDADFAGADIEGANFADTNISRSQLVATASYSARSLRRVNLSRTDLGAMSLNGFDLTGAHFDSNALEHVNFTDAIVTGTSFRGVLNGFTREDLYSTASYRNHQLSGIDLGMNDLAGWDFSRQNLYGARFSGNFFGQTTRLDGASFTDSFLARATFWVSHLQNADFARADLRGARDIDLTGAILKNTILPDGSIQVLALDVAEPILTVRDLDPVVDDNFGELEAVPVMVKHRMSVGEESGVRLVFDSDPWDSLISFEPGIPVQLDGTLELTFADGVDVVTQVGRTLQVFDWTGVLPVGQFTVASPYRWETTDLYTTGEVMLLAVPEPPGLALALCLASLATRLSGPARWSSEPRRLGDAR